MPRRPKQTAIARVYPDAARARAAQALARPNGAAPIRAWQAAQRVIKKRN
jgi:hypothetical protein